MDDQKVLYVVDFTHRYRDRFVSFSKDWVHLLMFSGQNIYSDFPYEGYMTP